MRKRFPISSHQDFVSALAAKLAAKAENPDKEYQIRKNQGEFRLVERLHSNEAEVVQGMRIGKRGKKRRSRLPIL